MKIEICDKCHKESDVFEDFIWFEDRDGKRKDIIVDKNITLGTSYRYTCLCLNCYDSKPKPWYYKLIGK